MKIQSPLKKREENRKIAEETQFLEDFIFFSTLLGRVQFF